MMPGVFDLCTHGHPWLECRTCADEEDRAPIAFIRRNKDAAAELGAILGLESDRWVDVDVHLTNDGPATCTVTLLLTPDQVTAIASLAARQAL